MDPSCERFQDFEGGYVWGAGSASVVSGARLYTITSTPFYLRLIGDSWVQQATGSPGSAPNRRLMFHMTADSSNNGQGQLMRSTDYGQTWTAVTAPSGADEPIDITRAADGKLWSIWADNSSTIYTAKVYYSVDSGLNWTHSLTNTTDRRAFFIAAHHSNANLIAFTTTANSANSQLGIRVTEDGGANWSAIRQVTPTGSLQTDTNQGGVVWTVSGGTDRLVVYQTRPGATQIRISDDKGVSWTSVQSSAVTKFWGQIIRGSNRVVFAVRSPDTSGGTGLYRSTDAGSSWNGLPVPSGVTNANSIAYDAAADSLYLGTQNGNNTYSLASASTVSSASWTSVTDPASNLTYYQRLVLLPD
jgi:hypothetical protein